MSVSIFLLVLNNFLNNPITRLLRFIEPDHWISLKPEDKVYVLNGDLYQLQLPAETSGVPPVAVGTSSAATRGESPQQQQNSSSEDESSTIGPRKRRRNDSDHNDDYHGPSSINKSGGPCEVPVGSSSTLGSLQRHPGDTRGGDEEESDEQEGEGQDEDGQDEDGQDEDGQDEDGQDEDWQE
ncbi:uncharacterized protein N7529_000212 [Penicillium soppii]|uniref:uncharacterized protein n=1 Tax=Penicillium soppii TaxID=69789 RepID=UPI0025496C0F|nr:uncharacterized protein N7529_000212 [Penicillium soppii]KAJ5881540.1 hypothetical protein N7529_000212 [Penicillium soppii]